MADVTLSYKGSDILELSDSGSATLKTGGKYCEDDIAVEYVKPSGGGENYIDLSDPSLWESRDFMSASAVGTPFSDCKTDVTTRISVIQPIEILDETVLVFDNTANFYFLLFDENKNYIGWSSQKWNDSSTNALAMSKIEFAKRSGDKPLSSARYVGISVRENSSNPTITTNFAQDVNLKTVSAGVT